MAQASEEKLKKGGLRNKVSSCKDAKAALAEKKQSHQSKSPNHEMGKIQLEREGEGSERGK